MIALVCSVGMWADEPSMLTIVGGATNAGWTDNEYNRTPGRMVRTAENTWVWAGQLNAKDGNDGNFKIPNSATGWNGYWADEADKQLGINDVEEFTLSTDGSGDKKFHVASTGMYRITINTSTLKMTVEKLKEPSKEGDFYLIGTVEDFMWYAGYVTSGGNTDKARLTADISFQGKNFFPISSDRYKFRGELDGAGHTIDNAVIDDPSERLGLCRYLGPGANIHDLVMGENCSFKGTSKVGGLAGHARDGGEVTFTNVINRATVTATGNTNSNAAGFVGLATDATKIIALNCGNTGAISGPNECAAFAGWTQDGSTFTNCWNIASITGQDGKNTLYRGGSSSTNCYDVAESNNATQISVEAITSGELCYKLNGDQSSIGWYQNLTGEVDAIPVPFSTSSQVYANGELKCDGTSAGGDLTYSNSKTSILPDHTDVDGWCSVCGSFLPGHLTADGEGFYSIGTEKELNWFATLVSTVNSAAKAKLTADIDYTAYKQGFIGVSRGSAFSGTFNGQEHTIKIDIVNAGSDRTGLFAYINAATIKNLVVEGSATSAGNNCVGGLGGRSDGDGTLIENVIVKTDVSYTGSNNDATCGGLFANMEGKVTLKNCAFLGSINTGTAGGNGGLVGWAGGGSNNSYENCLVAPVEYTKNGNSADFARNNPSTTNCIKVASDDARFATGELCYTLNAGGDNWYQNLTGEVDAIPVPFSTGHSKVYANASYNCDGTAKGAIVYANDNEESRDEHQPVDGFCTVCNAMTSYVADYMTPAEDGYYEISNNKQMRWFAATVNDVNTSVNARLTADIDFTGVKDYAPIGKEASRFVGTFDGQGHQITNLTLDLDQNEVGIFGVIAEGAVIKNFTLASSSSITGNNRVAIVGMAKRINGGDIHLECLGNEADITGHGKNVGGILGVNMNSSGYAKIYMTNCYSTGAIEGTGENGQLTGWGGDGAVVENCYAIGETTNCDGFGRFPGGCTITNCFSDKDLNWGPTQVTEEQLASGEVAAKLGDAFHQVIGEGYPVLDESLPNVYEIAVSDAGFATFVPKKNIAAIPAGVEAFAAQIGAHEVGSVYLAPVEELPADNAVIVKAAKGSYFCNSTESVRKIGITNDLTFSNEEETADGSQYILAKPEGEEVGFYQATTGKIAARKGYLVSNATVKAFYFAEESETAIENVNVNGNGNNGAIFNIAGQKLSKLQKGINIVNGKKVLY